MITPVAKRLQPLRSRFSISPATKKNIQNKKPFKAFEPSTHICNDKTPYPTGEVVSYNVGKKEMKDGETATNKTSSPTRDNVTHNVGRNMTTNGHIKTASWMDYPPELPYASSVYSNWLLNLPNPGRRSSHEHLSIEIIRRLDHPLR